MNRLSVRNSLLLLIALVLTAAPFPVGAQDEIVAGAEYFVDLDPGLGNATPLSPLDGGFDSSSEEIQFQVETADLTAGSHVVYIRLQDQNGQWGRPRSSAIKVVVADADVPPAVVAAEYFIDRDPGEGDGTSISGDFNGATADVSFNLDSIDLAAGSHVVYLRFQDENGVWGRPKSCAIQVTNPTQFEFPPVTAAEYFIDRDPGEGDATSISGSFGADTAELAFDIETADLPFGSHVVYVRLRDENGVWGRPRSAKVQVTTLQEMTFPALTAAEYFVDKDPGEGNATSVSGNFGDDTADISLELNTADIESGSHVAYLRFQDENGVWGRPKSAKIQVTLQEDMAFPAIVAAEYFVDEDPGEGSATSISGDFGGDTVELEYEVDTQNMDPGTHVAYTRFQDEEGNWGRPKSSTLVVTSETADAAPAIAAAEYFIDKDPGEGNATPLQPEDGSFDGDTEAGTVDISVEGLEVGRHVVYTRFQDADGNWGRPRGKFFNIRKTVEDTGDAEFQITAAEYFIDKDPGEGNATPMEPADGNWGGGFEEVAGKIESADLSVGTHTVSVRMQDQNGLWGRSRTVQFTVDPPPPEKPEMVVDDIGPHDFGTLKIDTSVEWTFTVSNGAGAEDTLKVRAVEVAEPFTASIEAFELAPGRSQRVTVTFFPTAEGTFTQNLTVRSNDVENPRLEIQLTGQAVPEQPQMVLSTPTDDHDFGAVRIGSVGEWPLVVSNEGVDSLRVLEMTTEAPFAVSPATFDVPPGGEQAVTVTFEPAEEGTIAGNLHIRANDPNRRETDISLSGEGVEFGVPVATVITPVDEQSGQVSIDFTITDDDDSPVTIGFAYEVGGTRRLATVTGIGSELNSAQYKGVTLTAIWDTDANLAQQDEVVRFVITVSDADHTAGKQAITADFRVDNNLPPAAQLTAPADPVGRVVEIPFELTDAETDLLSLTGEYSTDSGASWQPATVVSETTDINRYASSVLWDAFADLGYGRFTARFRLTPGDNDPGTPGEADLQISHLVADYDGSQLIDLDDLTLFLVAWNKLPKDASADIGPATGSLPDLVPVGDGRLDFEDVVVLIQMWNWSAKVYPVAKLAAGQSGPQALELESLERGNQVELDLRLTAGSLLSAGFALDYDPEAWELVDIAPGDIFADPGDLILLRQEAVPGQLVVQLGSLNGPATTTGSLLRFHFAPRTPGADGLRLSYDLRDGAGNRYASGRLDQQLRPVPERFFLNANHPNPFNPETIIPYGLAAEAVVDLAVYDVLGRQVAQPVPPTPHASGYYRVIWDSRDASGRAVGSGVYLYRLRARSLTGEESFTYTRRMLLLR
jgi:hypothetical protein